MDRPLTCKIIRSRKRRRTLSLSVDREGTLVLRAPAGTADSVLERFVREKETWICRKLAQITQERKRYRPKEFVSGEEFLLLGESYPLEIVENLHQGLPLMFEGDRFRLNRKCQGDALSLFTRWYREQAEVKIRQRVEWFSREMNLYPEREQISAPKCQWGRCSPRNALSFNWKLIMAPLPVIDYIVVHELAHIKEKNHSPRFWKIVENHLPDYRTRRNWLKQHGLHLAL